MSCTSTATATATAIAATATATAYTDPPPSTQLVRSINEDRWMCAADKLISAPHLTDVVAKGPKDEWSWYLKRTETHGVFLRNTYRDGVIVTSSIMDINRH